MATLKLGDAAPPAVDFDWLCAGIRVFDHFSAPVYQVDAAHRIVYGNRAFLQLFGLAARQLDHKPGCCDTLRYDRCQAGMGCICAEPLRTGRSLRVRELSARLADKTLNLYAAFVPLKSGTETRGLLVSLTDLSSEADLQGNFRELYHKEREKTLALERAQAELADLNRNLELKVEQRTAELRESRAEIRQVLDSIDRAILTFGADGRLSEGCSAASRAIFSVPDTRGLDIFTVLGLPEGAEGRKPFADWIRLCFTAYGNIAWEDLAFLSPFAEWNFGGRILQTRWNPVAADDRLQYLMMISRDVTEERRLAEQIRREREEHDREMAVLGRLLAAPEEEAQFFLRELSGRLQRLESFAGLPAAGLAAGVDAAYRDAHTIKGGAALLRFEELAGLAHELEHSLEEVRRARGADPAVLERMVGRWGRVRGAAGKILHWAGRLGLAGASGAEAHRRVKVEAGRLADLADLLRGQLAAAGREVNRERLEQALAFLRDATSVECGRYFHRFASMLERLAEDRGRKLAPLVVAGGSVRLDPDLAERFIDPLTHILRNAVDHGIEPPEERLALGKPAAGAIRLAVSLAAGRVRVLVQDDGRGIDAERVYRTYLEAGNAPLPAPTERDKLRLIFLGGVSTAASVSTVSGRGVGMDIVLSRLREMGGTVEVASVPGTGTTFTLEAPAGDG